MSKPQKKNSTKTGTSKKTVSAESLRKQTDLRNAKVQKQFPTLVGVVPTKLQLRRQDLINKYPEFFGKGALYVDGAISISDGWMGVLEALCRDLDFAVKAIRTQKGCAKTSINMAQIKEKFGGLRVYIDGNWTNKDPNKTAIYDIVYSLISRAEDDADSTCEVCGKHGRKSDYLSWIRTLCYTHYMPKLWDLVIGDVKSGRVRAAYRLFKAFLRKRLSRSYNATQSARWSIWINLHIKFIKLVLSDYRTDEFMRIYYPAPLTPKWFKRKFETYGYYFRHALPYDAKCFYRRKLKDLFKI